MSNRKLVELLKRQEEDRLNLAAGVIEQWRPIVALERDLLTPFNGEFENAPEEIQQQVSQNRKAFFAEWGSEGHLAVAMERRHVQERKDWAAREAKINEIKQKGRKGGNDGGR